MRNLENIAHFNRNWPITDAYYLNVIHVAPIGHIISSIHIYLYGCISLLALDCAVPIFVCLCDVKPKY